ncbi:amino acid ABC transporter permease [Aestuariirhabdus litorea]|uniref:Amino acid ABC transporter permease n=1 Tax=Aestuariirhabdus litorea TaxID=2528527 RepID=A0A3P3VJ47_9GAMM|nr:amino acid ABC transporter permease [Aestuariirhabdus litorea]RRJ82771.1 amino acid ABC transporter permease [Aestuariirhabdus litorea]RWW92931.1 ABC transporter permease subunit [Endozoicomonadaceae bacterium GTF-13]
MSRLTPPLPRSDANKRPWFLQLFYEEKTRAIIYQILVTGALILLGWYLVSNTLDNLARQNIATGYGFLSLEASFGISESMIAYSPADTYGRALMVGILNTIKVSIVGILLATLIGTLVGIARLSPNWLLRQFSGAYINTFRNVPLLLQLFFWYALINTSLPKPRQALNPFGDTFITNRGIYTAIPEYHVAYWWMLAAALLGMLGWWLLRRWAIRRQQATGQPFHHGIAGFCLTLLAVIAAYLLAGAPSAMDAPVLQGFNFKGGWNISTEFTALLLGLTIYTSTYIAEIVRSGIESVPKGQWEASNALGLRPGQILREIILPQALRVIIPPLTNQFLNLTKNSSLAVAVGYPDLVSISNTTMNQTGQAIEAIAIFMTIYLSLSLGISLFMNWYNNRMALVER